MAKKKSRRPSATQHKKQTIRPAAPAPVTAETGTPSTRAEARATTARAAGRRMDYQTYMQQMGDKFREEYRYVVADLRRLGILAAVMFVVLIALALISPMLGF